MTQLGDITSTEKLLKVIRSKGELGSAPAEPPAKKPGSIRVPATSSISPGKLSTVGIDIGHEYLRLVRTAISSKGTRQIIDRWRFVRPPKTPIDSPQFASFLKSSLSSACGSPKQSDLWAIMSSAGVDLHHMRIPRVGKKQINNAVYWTARKEAPYNEKEMVFDFEVQGEVIEQGIPKLAVMFYTAPRRDVEDLRSLFSGIGWPLKGISIVPFAVQNLFRTGWMQTGEGPYTSLFIGNDFSRIDVYSEGNLVMTRGIRAGNSSLVESLVEQYNDLNSPGAAPLTPAEARKILFSLSPDAPPLHEADAGFGLAKEKIFEMIQPALERLVRQVERTSEHFISIQGNEKISKIFVAYAMNIYQPMIDYVGAQLGIAGEVLDPLSVQDSIPACRDVDDSNCLSERVAFAPALGIALSDNDNTPNLLFTQKEKESEASVKRINQAVFAVFIIVVLICSGIFFYQIHAIKQREAAIAGFESELARTGPAVDRNQLLKVAGEISQRRDLSKVYADRYLGMVMIGEIAALTPANIRLLDLKANLSFVQSSAAVKTTGENPKVPPVEEVTVDGLILGERQKLEASLAGYMMILEASPLFSQVTIRRNSVEPYLNGEALHFILNLKVEEQVHG